MSKRKEKRINNCEPTKIWFWFLSGVFFLGLFSYGYLVRGTIVDIVARQNMENQISTLSSKVLNLESEYIKVKNNITPTLAQNLGFVSVTTQKFITRDIKTPGLSMITPGL